MYRPTNSAIGIVQAMVKVPQELPGISCTQPSAGQLPLRIDVSRLMSAPGCMTGRVDAAPERVIANGSRPDCTDRCSRR